MHEISDLTGLETKIARPDAQAAEAQPVLDQLMRGWEAFKESNDRRLDEIERRMSADIVSEEKVDRINRALDEQKARLDELHLKAQRPALDSCLPDAPPHTREHRRAFDDYVRKGEAGALIAIERKALSAGSGPDGGYLVPEETEAQIDLLLREASPMRKVASVRQVSSAVFKKPFAIAGAATGWVSETSSRPETAGPTLSELQFPAMEIYAMPAASQTILDDAVVDIDQWLAEEVQTAFVEKENEAFILGDGVAKPRGFLNYPKLADEAWSWGSLGYMPSGAAGAFSAEAPADALVDLVYALKSGYRQNAAWMMNRKTQGEIRKIKDAAGNYLWQPAAAAAAPASLLGYPVTEAETMPSVAPDGYAIAFGDFRRGYLIVDRIGIRVLRDPFSAKPYVLFYTTKRVGGGVQNFEAIKLMKFSVN